MSSIEPPDMSILKDRSQLEFYILALERWATIAKVSGVAETLLEETVLTHAFKQAPDLCRELSDDLSNSTGDNSAGIGRIISRLQEKFGVNKHVDMVKI